MFTIITPTYNRAHLIGRAYYSLCKQKDFISEWIIIDDGSSDGTESMILNIGKDSSFPILYVRQDNSGKHVALNKAIQFSKGIYTCILDSDDYLLDDACDRMYSLLANTSDNIIGVVGNCLAHQGNSLIGTEFPLDKVVCSPFQIRDKYKVKGDKKGAMKTDFLKKYIFPEFPGEKFLKEELVWNRIGKDFNYVFVNQVFTIMDYQETGLSSTSVKRRIQSINGTMTYHTEFFDLPVSMIAKSKNAINLGRFWFHRPRLVKLKINWIALCLLMSPLSAVLFIRDIFKSE